MQVKKISDWINVCYAILTKSVLLSHLLFWLQLLQQWLNFWVFLLRTMLELPVTRRLARAVLFVQKWFKISIFERNPQRKFCFTLLLSICRFEFLVLQFKSCSAELQIQPQIQVWLSSEKFYCRRFYWRRVEEELVINKRSARTQALFPYLRPNLIYQFNLK